METVYKKYDETIENIITNSSIKEFNKTDIYLELLDYMINYMKENPLDVTRSINFPNVKTEELVKE